MGIKLNRFFYLCSEHSSFVLAAMELEQKYEISRTAEFIHSRNFTRIALQFPDELLKDSTKVSEALKQKIHSLKKRSDDATPVRLCVMADTTYGSCCVDEVGASHVDAHCVVHYGHTCLSPTSKIPAFFVFGKACVDASLCAKTLLKFSASSNKTVVVLHGLEYAHAIPNVKEELVAELSERPESETRFVFADVTCSEIDLQKGQTSYKQCESNDDPHLEGHHRHKIGGLVWDLPIGKKMEDCLLLWIGSDNSAFANVVLTFNTCEIVRYDAKENQLVTDLSQQRRILKRRYFLVEKAKDANIVGIVVGTLGVAGYLDMIHKMKDLITGVGKKAYTLVMGRPNPAKLANFPECDVFIYVSCAQTALLNSKEFLAPVITPFEAMLAFNRGSEWTGEYVMEFRDLMNESPVEATKHSEEARFSFIQGRYVEDLDLQENEEEDGVLALTKITEKALQLRDGNSASVNNGTIKSGAEYYATRTYHGLEMHNSNAMPEQYLVGRSGKASGYQNEKQEAG